MADKNPSDEGISRTNGGCTCTLFLLTSSHEHELNQVQRSLRSLTEPILGDRTGQSLVEPRNEPI